MHIDHDDRGSYILAAAVLDVTALENVRDEMRRLLLPGQQRLHWRDERAARRSQIASTLASIGVTAVVVVGGPLVRAKQERARRVCMESLLPRLEGMGVSDAWFESRTKSLNLRDQRMVSALRGQRLITRALKVGMALPSEEPMLWIPDAVAGAVNAARASESDWLKSIGERVEITHITLR